MRVLITGGMGMIGQATAALLRDRGWDVSLIDIVPETEVTEPNYTACDIMDFEAVRRHIHGNDAVVHLAALKNPLFGPGQDVYRINTSGTFNIFEAAGKGGVQRVVQASSINAIGCGWNVGGFDPQYLPVDEDHPSVTTDPYSLSKRHVEEIGDYYWRRDGIVSVALRFPGVMAQDRAESEQFQQTRAAMHQYLNEYLALPDAEQKRIMADVRERGLAFRRGRPLEYPGEWPKVGPTDSIDMALWKSFTLDRHHLWATLDERDAARAIEASLTADIQGGPALFVNDDINFLDYDSRTLARLFFPDSKVDEGALEGSASLVDASRARELIGFVPQYPLPRFRHAETR
jgi:nucleoside-diphosphate-sugar epimerase